MASYLILKKTERQMWPKSLPKDHLDLKELPSWLFFNSLLQNYPYIIYVLLWPKLCLEVALLLRDILRQRDTQIKEKWGGKGL